MTGDYLFDPRAGPKWDKFDDHVAQIIELLGELPKDYALSGRFSNDIFNRKGEPADFPSSCSQSFLLG